MGLFIGSFRKVTSLLRPPFLYYITYSGFLPSSLFLHNMAAAAYIIGLRESDEIIHFIYSSVKFCLVTDKIRIDIKLSSLFFLRRILNYYSFRINLQKL